MSPTVRHDPISFELDQVTSAPEPARARGYAFTLLVVACALVAALALNGADLPRPGLLLVFAIPLALCMNRYLFFPNEVGVTADAAILFAAMVAFRDDAQWLGPLVLALLAGPLDARHWGARAYTRMAFNSGSTALSAAAGLAAFVPLSHAFGTGWEATLGAAGVAAVPYIVVESVVGITLVLLLAERPADAARDQLPQGCIALPLAVLGAAAGLAALGVGWWVALVVLIPVPIAPELVLVELPRRIGARRSLDVVLVGAGIALLGLSAFVGPSTIGAVIGLCALGCLMFADNPPRRSVPLPPLLALAVVAASGVYLDFAASTAMVVMTTAAGVAYLALTACWERRSWWALPVVGFAAALAVAAGSADVAGVASFGVGVLVGLVLCATWGPLPWRSRYIGPLGARVRQRPRFVALLAPIVAATVLTIAAMSASGSTRSTLALGVTAIIELEVAMVVLAVRLWRFRVQRRRIDITALVVIATLAVTVVLPAMTNGDLTVAVVAVVACLGAVLGVAWPLAAAMAEAGRSDDARS